MRIPWLRSVDTLAPPTHEELIRLVALGDEAAFAELYDAVAPRVFGLVRRVVRDPAQSQEVTQEVFIDIWTQASRYDADRGKAISWILVIAHRKAVDKVRASQASSDRDLRQGIKEFQESYDDVADTVETRLEAERVNKALETLTAPQQEAIRLAYYGGYTHQEVADFLKIPVGTVKTRIRDGMIRLRDRLGVA
ncbi:ECF RNA polymerase sigma factor SigK [Arthrobacter psychrochitiniphilus]|uniref:RNA polymerase sigma factor n=1 Tax=Arthrobacter psychrochitiniphilus TaxID=291045 RepID=A0A2V3DN68_9MICC|nr:ECF RNA polymerase sigma factor SigK [Arthrobacter psychrochitiniphilus]NYG18516.1 RNA polymerase sigma-70 factor (ECF subfamily) [Arthrobacter psychrochitiniphilus]PXA64395.1 RNA polymerase subunit sigma [Arthrobacter psychrochitiniphilus]